MARAAVGLPADNLFVGAEAISRGFLAFALRLLRRSPLLGERNFGMLEVARLPRSIHLFGEVGSARPRDYEPF